MSLTLLLVLACAAYADGPPKTRNVILVVSDGLRWQEVFGGADAQLVNKENGGVEDLAAFKKEFWRETPEQRREVLLPFLWSVVARQGQLYGNRDKVSQARVTNAKDISYPGYSEMLCGFADPRIDSNDKRPNPNVTVFEWLHAKPAYRGRVAAFGAWDTFPFIFNGPRCGFPVDGGCEPLTQGQITPRLELLNRLRRETPQRWGGAPFDSFVFHAALEWFKANRPRVLFVGLGETDEWAHEGRYKEYLEAARRADAYLRELWETAQSMPDYKDQTTLIVTADHGRGESPQEWKSHGEKQKGSENIWIAILGPDTPSLGERGPATAVRLSQVAATIAAALGEDYCAAFPQAAPPIGEAIAMPR